MAGYQLRAVGVAGWPFLGIDSMWESTASLREPLIAFAVLGLYVGSFCAVGWWILMPIDRAAKARNAPARFLIADFLCLFVIIQLPLAAVHQLAGEGEESLFWAFTALTWIIAPVIWLVCTRSLSRAGIRGGWRRMVFVGFIVPIAYYGLVLFVLLSVYGVIRLFARRQPFDQPLMTPATHWFALIALGAVLYASGLSSRWLVRKANEESGPVPDGELTLSRVESV
jgi:hypothetical protein